MGSAPSGTVTFVFTDVEGSTAMWDSDPSGMREVLERHDEIVRGVIAAHDGYVFATGGDGFCVAFGQAADAVGAAIEIQRALTAESWRDGLEVRVRVGMHTGEAYERDGDYFGPAVNRAARVMSLASGGVVCCSEATEQSVRGQLPGGATFTRQGEYRLKGFAEPEVVFTVSAEGFPAVTSLALRPLSQGNLPRLLVRLVGRSADVTELAARLPASALTTLVGPGGVGKTSLAKAGASAVRDSFPEGVWWLDLAPLASERDVAFSLAALFGVVEQPGEMLVDILCVALAERRMLLVLDNGEHLVEPLARLVTRLVQSCEHLGVLVTSRVALGVAGESMFPVAPLPTEGISGPAMELLAERIGRPGLLDDPQELSGMVDICQQLDGLPLALELAAARCAVLPPSEVAPRLRSGLGLLADQRRLDDRQRTMTAVIRWSYDLLDEVDRVAARQLSVFVGGFTLNAAELVCAETGLDAVEVLTVLVRVSLVEQVGRRFRWLETTRQFMRAELDDAGETAAALDAHLRYFCNFAREARVGLRGADEPTWVALVDADWANLRAAFRCAVERGDADRVCDLVCSLTFEGLFRRPELFAWTIEARDALGDVTFPRRPELLGAAGVASWSAGDIAGCLRDGIEAIDVASGADGALDALPTAAAMLGWCWSGEFQRALDLGGELVAAATRAKDSWLRTFYLNWLVTVHAFLGAPQDAGPEVEAGLAAAATTGSPTAWAVAQWAASMRAPDHQRRSLLREALGHAREASNTFVTYVAEAELATLVGETDEPFQALKELVATIGEFRDTGRRLHAWAGVASAATLLARTGNMTAAAKLLGACEASPVGKMLDSRMEEWRQRAAKDLAHPEAVAARAAGGGMNLSDAINLLQHEAAPSA